MRYLPIRPNGAMGTLYKNTLNLNVFGLNLEARRDGNVSRKLYTNWWM